MSSQYKCTLCSKEFKQKIDYTRHKNKKNACITADKLQQVVEQKINHDTTVKNMSTLFSGCMNILRDNESLTGDKALRNLSYLLVLKLIEPMIGNEIDFDIDYPTLPQEYKNSSDLLKYVSFSNLTACNPTDVYGHLQDVWDHVLSYHPKTCDIFIRGKGFDIKKQVTFKKLLEKLSEFDFSSVDVDIQGHAYEDLLKDIMTGKVLGQFFTQPLVKNMMVDLINPQLLDDGTCETIFDPAMGTGGFLMTSLRHLQKQAEDRKINIDWSFISSEGIGGREAEPDTFQMSKTNMLISCGHMIDNLQQGDSIRDPIKGKYDIVLANPPFGIKGLEYQEIKKECKMSDEYLPIESNSAVPLFLQVIISILKVGGRCAIVMPDGKELFGKSNALIALREYLMKTCDLREVIYLPSGVFSNTSIKTCVFYFHKKLEVSEVINKPQDKKVKTYKFKSPLQTKIVKFYDYNPYEKVKNLLIEVDARKIAENNYSLNYAEYLDSQERDEENSEVEWKTLGEVCEINYGTRIVRKHNTEGEYPVYGSGREMFTTENYNREDFNVLIGRFALSENCVRLVNHKLFLNDSGMTVKPKTDLLQHKYIGYYLFCNQKIIYDCARGTAQKNMDMDKFKSLKIPIPSLQAQQRIVERLDYLYETCTETSRSLIEQSKTKKAMMVEMGTEGVQTKPLAEVCQINQGNSLTKEQMNEDIGENPVLGGGKIIGYYNKTNREGNSITLTRVGDINVTYMKIPHFLTDNGFSLICNHLTTTKYVYYYLSSNKQILQNSYKGTAQKVISKTNLKLIEIPIPSLQTQQRIVQECERLDKLITDLEADIESDKSLANNYLKSCIESPQEYTDIIISDEEYSETEEQQYTDIIISDEDYEEE